jgi:Flp pilus assembly protein TadD
MPTLPVESKAIQISKGPVQGLTDPKLIRAYHDFQAGDYSQAEPSYRSVLQHYPDNRDALLGLAAIAVRKGRRQEATWYYRRLLDLNPKDSIATAALLNLQGSAEGEITESRIKLLTDQEPNAPHLYFSLGNLYARQGRWAEAEQAYFQASHLDPQNPDYAFNLAVSLDRLGQTRSALDYYRKALALGDQGPMNFSASRLLARIQSLSHAVSQDRP